MQEGDVFRTKAPFVRKNYTGADTWQWGMRRNFDGMYENYEADGEGDVEYQVIKIIEMPKPYKTRYFFRKRLIDPDGKILKWRPIECGGYKALQNRTQTARDYEIINQDRDKEE